MRKVTGDTIRAARRRRGLTQIEAANEVGVHWNTWARWERGERTPTGLYRKALVEWMLEEGGHKCTGKSQ